MNAPRHQLADDKLLTTMEALAYLAERGIHTSRSGLDEAFRAGRLSRIKVRARVRILYRTRDLLAAFIIGEETCPSNSGRMPTASGKSAARSQASAYERALALATKPRRESTPRASSAKRGSGTLIPFPKD